MNPRPRAKCQHCHGSGVVERISVNGNRMHPGVCHHCDAPIYFDRQITIRRQQEICMLVRRERHGGKKGRRAARRLLKVSKAELFAAMIGTLAKHARIEEYR